jgi:hypothetical protein
MSPLRSGDVIKSTISVSATSALPTLGAECLISGGKPTWF